MLQNRAAPVASWMRPINCLPGRHLRTLATPQSISNACHAFLGVTHGGSNVQYVANPFWLDVGTYSFTLSTKGTHKRSCASCMDPKDTALRYRGNAWSWILMLLHADETSCFTCAVMKSASKRKSAKRKAAGDEDYEPAAAAAPAVASSETSYPKQQSSPYIGVTKVFSFLLVYCCLGVPSYINRSGQPCMWQLRH